MSTTTPGGRRWSVVLLVVATVGGVGTTMTWVRAQGSVIPSSTDLTDRAVTRSGAPVELAARGVVGLAGAVALVAACLLAALALWAVSPGYRRARAGYAAIGGSTVGIAAVVWFLTDAAAHSSVFGAAVDVQTDTVEVSAWAPGHAVLLRDHLSRWCDAGAASGSRRPHTSQRRSSRALHAAASPEFWEHDAQSMTPNMIDIPAAMQICEISPAKASTSDVVPARRRRSR